MPSKKSSSFARIVILIAALVGALFVLRFVMSITWGILKYGALGALAVFVVYLFMAGGDDKAVEGSERKKLRG
jgi:hypothetical protein